MRSLLNCRGFLQPPFSLVGRFDRSWQDHVSIQVIWNTVKKAAVGGSCGFCGRTDPNPPDPWAIHYQLEESVVDPCVVIVRPATLPSPWQRVVEIDTVQVLWPIHFSSVKNTRRMDAIFPPFIHRSSRMVIASDVDSSITRPTAAIVLRKLKK